MGFLSIGAQSAAEDGGCIELVTPELTHQARTGSIEESPTDELFHRRNRSISDRLFLVTEPNRIDRIGKPCFLLSDLSLELFDFRWTLGLLQILDILVQIRFDAIGLGIWITTDHWGLPRIVPRQVSSVPLSADVVELAEHTPTDQMDCVVVQNAVVPLVAGCQVERFT